MARRRRFRIFERVFSGILFVVLLLLGVLYFSLDSFRTPHGVRLEGNSLISDEVIYSLPCLSESRPFLFMDKDQISGDVLSQTQGVLDSFVLEGNLFSCTAHVEEVVPLFKDEQNVLYFSNGMTLESYGENLQRSGLPKGESDGILARINEDFDAFLRPHGPKSMDGNWGLLFSRSEAFSSFKGISFSFLAGEEDLRLLGMEFPRSQTTSFGSFANILFEDSTNARRYLIREVPVESLGSFLSDDSIPTILSRMKELVDEGLKLGDFSFEDTPDLSYSCYSFVYQE